MNTESYLTREFTIDDPDARLRMGDDLSQFVRGADGKPVLIPNRTRIAVQAVRTMPVGSRSVNIFVKAATIAGAELGWTSANNLKGRFLSETIGEIPPADTSQTGNNAAWSHGVFLGQITLVKVVGTQNEIEYISRDVCDNFLDLAAAAAAAGHVLALNSGFRTFREQKALHDGFLAGIPGFNLAAPPGASNHQSGIAFDFDVRPGEGNPVYEWMKDHAPAHGFVRTVKSEAWHWEFLPKQAKDAVAAGVFGTWML